MPKRGKPESSTCNRSLVGPSTAIGKESILRTSRGLNSISRSEASDRYEIAAALPQIRSHDGSMVIDVAMHNGANAQRFTLIRD